MKKTSGTSVNSAASSPMVRTKLLALSGQTGETNRGLAKAAGEPSPLGGSPSKKTAADSSFRLDTNGLSGPLMGDWKLRFSANPGGPKPSLPDNKDSIGLEHVIFNFRVERKF
ncbi:MAG: hypothetical protein PHV34_00245 [Verrucomicrobiae bacterium]|nr:hypothetical protein [Verrucomicrobiae bacterium]